MADCFIGIDLGTSGCRGVAIDDRGVTLAQAATVLPPSRHPRPGASEQSPDDWWAAVARVLRELLTQKPGAVRALSVDGTSSTLLLCDADGVPCAPGLMYDDRRAVPQAQTIAQHAPADCAARGPGSALAKLLYLHEKHPHVAAHAVHQADWISGRLAARHGISDENNVLKLGYDVVERHWPEWMTRLPLPLELLPEVLPVGSPVGPIAPAIAAAFGLPTDVLVVAGTTDSNAAALAAGIEAPGDAVTSLGSTLVLKIFAERPVFAADYGVYSHRLGDSWLIGGASNTGGRVLRQFFSDRQIKQLSARIDTERVLNLGYYPLPTPGERFPRNDPHLEPRLTPRPEDPAEFLQAMLEGIADVEATGYARLTALGAPTPRRVFTSGGGAANEAWQRIRARRLGLPVLRAVHTEAAYGTALLARAAVGARSTSQSLQ